MAVSIPRETEEKLETVVRTDVDPTPGGVEFAFTQGDTRPATWYTGEWDGVWADGKATAVSPVLGGEATSAQVKLAVGEWLGWVKILHLPERPVRKCGKVRIQ